MSLPFALAALVAPLSITTNTAGAAIEFPTIDSLGSVVLTLAEGVYTGVGVVQNTRMYNSQPVGPTIRVTPGQHVMSAGKRNCPDLYLCYLKPCPRSKTKGSALYTGSRVHKDIEGCNGRTLAQRPSHPI